MKTRKNNICKFVTEQDDNSLIIINFIYENNAAKNGIMNIASNNSMFLAVSGTGKITMSGKSHTIEAGTLFFSFANVPYTLENSDLGYMYITFNGGRTRQLFERFGINPENCVFPGFSSMISFWTNSISRAASKNLDLISESVVLYTFSQMVQPEISRDQDITNRVISYVEEAFADRGLTLTSCAEKLGYNPKYLSRIFKQESGITFSEYLKSIRIKHAVFLIEQGITLVKNIALLCGYDNPMYFSKVFRQTIGISPKDYITKQSSQNSVDNPSV